MIQVEVLQEKEIRYVILESSCNFHYLKFAIHGLWFVIMIILQILKLPVASKGGTLSLSPLRYFWPASCHDIPCRGISPKLNSSHKVVPKDQMSPSAVATISVQNKSWLRAACNWVKSNQWTSSFLKILSNQGNPPFSP